MRSSMLSGRSIGRKDSVCGQMGVIRIAGISGCTSEPPADNCSRATVSVGCVPAVPAKYDNDENEGKEAYRVRGRSCWRRDGEAVRLDGRHMVFVA